MTATTDFIKRVGRAGRNTLAVVTEPPWAKPGHFYSPLSTREDAARAVTWLADLPVGVDLREAEQLALVAELQLTLPSGPRYPKGSAQYGPPDAAVLAAMLKRFKPKRVLEVGSGHSTAVILDTDPGVGVTCVEPYPQRLLDALLPGDRDRLTLLQSAAQDVPIDTYLALEAGDVLFIDSTHVVKPGSDVVWLYLHVLPRLQPGVLVHIHDIFWPFEYPESWLEQRRDWTELYLLRALLTGSNTWEMVLFSSWLWREHPNLIPADLMTPAPSNIWLRRK